MINPKWNYTDEQRLNIIKNRKFVMGVLYHKWGVALSRDPNYTINNNDRKLMEEYKQELEQLGFGKEK